MTTETGLDTTPDIGFATAEDVFDPVDDRVDGHRHDLRQRSL